MYEEREREGKREAGRGRERDTGKGTLCVVCVLCLRTDPPFNCQSTPVSNLVLEDGDLDDLYFLCNLTQVMQLSHP